MFSRLQKAVGVYRRYAALVKLRAENPSCSLLSHHIYDARLGKNVVIHRGTILNRVCMGNFSYVVYHSILLNVDVGSFCSIGPQVQIGLVRHPSSTFVSTYPAFYSHNNEGCLVNFREDKIFDDCVPKTIIGNDVWIGSNVIIPGGIRIGTGAILAVGSVVVQDVPPYAIVGGNPAKVIRYRFSDEQIKLLLESEWWNWSIDKIKRNVGEFSDIDKFKAIAH